MKTFYVLLGVLFFGTPLLLAQTSLCGTVVNAEGEALIGTNIQVLQTEKSLQLGTTDFDGVFCFTLAAGNYELVFTYPGMVTHKEKVTIPSGTTKQEVKIKMEEATALEVVEINHGCGISAEMVKARTKEAKIISRTVDVAPAKTAVTSAALTSGVSIRGSRAASPDYALVEGIRIRNSHQSLTVAGVPPSESLTFAQLENVIAAKEKTKVGLLTAGEWNPHEDWAYWKDQQKKQFQKAWELYPTQRYQVEVFTTSGSPLANCSIELLNRKGGTVIWTARSDNQGKAILWNSLFRKKGRGKFSLRAHYQGESYTINSAQSRQVNRFELAVDCPDLQEVDIQFVIDATASMQDEINYLKSEIQDVIQRVEQAHGDLNIRTSSVVYRDFGDEYLTQVAPFGNLSSTLRFLQTQRAAGGGDTPEAVDYALEVALQQEWRSSAIARILFLVLDAPSRQESHNLQRLHRIMEQASQKGIKIIPITASGMDRSGEFLVQSLAAITNGTYVFLTDDSGIGEVHLEAKVKSYKVALLNDLLVRLIKKYSQQEACTEEAEELQEFAASTTAIPPVQSITNQDGAAVIRYYPNPASSKVFVELDQPLDQIQLFQINGTLIRQIESPQPGRLQIDVSNLSGGLYILRFQQGNRVWSKKLVVGRA